VEQGKKQVTITAKVIADSMSPAGIRLTTLQLRYPKFIHGEFMTHRVFSRNASSSRAIPVERLIADVEQDPVYPSFWGKNQPGMQAKEEHNGIVAHPAHGGDKRNVAWIKARTEAVEWARAFAEAGYHKQIVNRLLEPFAHINVVVTSTEWSNFFALRCHPDAQPEMQMLAKAIRDARDASEPKQVKPRDWHLPYVNEDDWIKVNAGGVVTPDQHLAMVKLSVARCARVSYLTQEGKTPTVEEDLRLYDRLVSAVPLHASPAEHQATPDTRVIGYEAQGSHRKWEREELHGNFRGWVQYRKTLAGENQ
jgi:thymidylate synthase ThyX